MKFLDELKVLLNDSVETGKEIIYIIILANLAIVFAYMVKGHEDVVGLALKMLFITMFMPLLFTLRKHFMS